MGKFHSARRPVAPAYSRGQYGLRRRGRGGTGCTQTSPTTANRLTRPASTPQRSTCTINAMPLPLLDWLERTGLSASDTGPRPVLSDFQHVHIATASGRTRSCGCRTCGHRMCRHDQLFACRRRAPGSASSAACRGGRAGQVALSTAEINAVMAGRPIIRWFALRAWRITLSASATATPAESNPARRLQWRRACARL